MAICNTDHSVVITTYQYVPIVDNRVGYVRLHVWRNTITKKNTYIYAPIKTNNNIIIKIMLVHCIIIDIFVLLFCSAWDMMKYLTNIPTVIEWIRYLWNRLFQHCCIIHRMSTVILCLKSIVNTKNLHRLKVHKLLCCPLSFPHFF